jgi:hypothetical protein
MNYNIKSLFCVFSVGYCFLFNEKLSAFEEYNVSNYKNQLYSEVTPLEYGKDKDGNTIYYKVQHSIGQQLYLGPNEVFFSPIDKLVLGGETKNDALELNKGAEFEWIQGLREENSQLQWSFITKNAGVIDADFILSGTSDDAGLILSIQIDDLEPSQVEVSSAIITDGKMQFHFENLEPGFHVLNVNILNTINSNKLKIFNVRLSGSALLDSYIVRERWRPDAVYSEWRSSKNASDVKAWIMELSSDSELGHYSPITTNFGYYGPIFKPGGSALRMNMSIWSSSENEEPLPIFQRSHLLGIGSDKGEFSVWNTKEGTGAKVEKWNNFETNTSKKYIIGLRYTYDGNFRTYYGYFWNDQTNNWQLYSVGRKYDLDPLNELKTKGFIEVVGGAGGERSNHKVREVKYKGFVCNSNGVWSDLDRLVLPKYSEMTNHRRGIAEDGESFFTSTGGLENRILNTVTKTLKKPSIVKRPLYMEPSKLQGFFSLPFIPKIENVTLSENGLMAVKFQTNTSFASKVTLCWGTQDALSIEENWENSTTFDLAAGESNFSHLVEIPATANVKYFRILVRDSRAQMWSFETFSLAN